MVLSSTMYTLTTDWNVRTDWRVHGTPCITITNTKIIIQNYLFFCFTRILLFLPFQIFEALGPWAFYQNKLMKILTNLFPHSPPPFTVTNSDHLSLGNNGLHYLFCFFSIYIRNLYISDTTTAESLCQQDLCSFYQWECLRS